MPYLTLYQTESSSGKIKDYFDFIACFSQLATNLKDEKYLRIFLRLDDSTGKFHYNNPYRDEYLNMLIKMGIPLIIEKDIEYDFDRQGKFKVRPIVIDITPYSGKREALVLATLVRYCYESYSGKEEYLPLMKLFLNLCKLLPKQDLFKLFVLAEQCALYNSETFNSNHTLCTYGIKQWFYIPKYSLKELLESLTKKPSFHETYTSKNEVIKDPNKIQKLRKSVLSLNKEEILEILK